MKRLKAAAGVTVAGTAIGAASMLGSPGLDDVDDADLLRQRHAGSNHMTEPPSDPTDAVRRQGLLRGDRDG